MLRSGLIAGEHLEATDFLAHKGYPLESFLFCWPFFYFACQPAVVNEHSQRMAELPLPKGDLPGTPREKEYIECES